MANKFLDFNGLEIYDTKIKEYINRKIDEVINISLFGNLGYSLIGQGPSKIPTWAENSGYRICETEGNIGIKIVASENWKIENGGIFAIKFLHAHSSEDIAQLSINGIIAPIVWEDNLNVTFDNSWKANETVIICYQEEKWVILKKSPNQIKSSYVHYITIMPYTFPKGIKSGFITMQLTTDTKEEFTFETLKSYFKSNLSDTNCSISGLIISSDDTPYIPYNIIYQSNVDSIMLYFVSINGLGEEAIETLTNTKNDNILDKVIQIQ